jgi:hypothetical protein
MSIKINRVKGEPSARTARLIRCRCKWEVIKNADGREQAAGFPKKVVPLEFLVRLKAHSGKSINWIVIGEG